MDERLEALATRHLAEGSQIGGFGRFHPHMAGSRVEPAVGGPAGTSHREVPMSSQPIRDPKSDHLLSPQSAALLDHV